MLVSLTVIVVAALIVLAVPALRDAATAALHGDGTLLRAQLRDLGAGGVLVLIAVMIVHAVVFYPTEIVTATAGYVYGFAGALPLVLGGWLASALVTYWLGRQLGRPALRRLVGPERLARAERALARGGAPVLLAARLIPIVPYSPIGYVAGATRVPLWTFAWTTVVGILPLTVLVIVLGTRLETFSFTDPVVWLAALPLLVLAVAARPLARRMRL